MLVRSETAEEKEIWVVRVLSSCRFLLDGDAEGVELAFEHYMECAPPSNVVDEKLGCVRLHRATTDCGEDEGEEKRSVEESYCRWPGNGQEQFLF